MYVTYCRSCHATFSRVDAGAFVWLMNDIVSLSIAAGCGLLLSYCMYLYHAASTMAH